MTSIFPIKLIGQELNPDATERYLKLFQDVVEVVQEQYVDDVDSKELIESALNGMLMSLDPHSGYLDEKYFDNLRLNTKGEFGGLGIEVTMENGFVKVVSPIDGTPAARAGIQSGDIITHLDDVPVLGMTLDDAIEIMRGEVGKKIVITLLREGVDDPFDKEIIRDIIELISVSGEVKYNVGYVRITTFNEKTSRDLKKVIKKFKKEHKNLYGYVIDLRNNPGGLLDQAVEVSDAFLSSGEIVSIRNGTGEVERFTASYGDIVDEKPIVVIINSGSASASEIVAGALQDHKRAVLVGTDSFGKGSVQTIMPIRDGAIRLTTAKYYTPSGKSIQSLGIIPDVFVENISHDYQENMDSEKRRINNLESDLPGRLENTQIHKDQLDKIKKIRKERMQIAETRFKDPQLGYSFDLILGMHSYNKISHR